MNLAMSKKVRDAISFLDDHPAMNTEQLFGRALWFSIRNVCKRGYDECVKRSGVNIYPSSKMASMFKTEFEKEYKKLEETHKKYPDEKNLWQVEKKFVSVSVPYDKLFGEPWKYDHTEYWGEFSFLIYHGDPKKPDMDMNPSSWQAYNAHIDVSANTYEEMIVKIADKFKKIYGNFKSDDFLTEKERKNHSKEKVFFFVDKKGSSFKSMKKNSKWIDVTRGELNHRWAKWFLKTPYGKKHWDSKELREMLK